MIKEIIFIGILVIMGILFFTQDPPVEEIMVRDTITIREEVPPDTVISEVVRFEHIVDSSAVDSLLALLEDVRKELDNGQIRQYTDTVKFSTGDSLHVKLKGILFDSITYALFPAPRETHIINNYYDSRDEIWFYGVIGGGFLENSGVIDVSFIGRKWGGGFFLGYEFGRGEFVRGVKLIKVLEIPKFKWRFL